MKPKGLFFIFSLLALLALVACGASGGVEPTAGPSVLTPEQAVAGALTDYLEGQGAPVGQMNLEVKTIADDYAWVEVVSTDPAVPGGFNAFMKLENDVWTTVVSGSGMEKEQIEALGIPRSVWPESWLSQAAQPVVTVLMTTEQAIVRALTDYLEGQGAPVGQMNLEVKTIADGYAWVEVVSTDPAVPGGFNAFMKRENDVWTTVVSGSGMEKEQVEALGIPRSVWPESWLSQVSQSTSESSPPICPDLPRPAMVFQADNGEVHILRHVASNSECTMQFDPPISRLLLLAADGVYYSTPDNGGGSTNQRIVHYANDGTLTELSFLNADNIGSIAISSDGTRIAWSIAWSQRRAAKATEGEEKDFSELYSANIDGSDMRLLHSVDNAAEVARGEPYIAWRIRPLRFLDENDLLFTIEPDGRGGSWNAYTGRYNNLYQSSRSRGESVLVYECPADDYSSFCIGAISADGAYFAVTNREASEVTLFHIDGTPIGTYSGPGQDYAGFPTFSPDGDLVFMTADVAEDQITIEQAYMSLVTKPYEAAATTLLSEPLSYIWDWADEQHILYTAVGDGQMVSFSPSLVNLDGRVERIPETYGFFQGVLP